MFKKKRLKAPKTIQLKPFIPTEDKHKQFSDELTNLIKRHDQVLRPVEVIAILSYTIGGLLTLLADAYIRNGSVLHLIQSNIDKGNEDANNSIHGLKLLTGETE